MPLPADTPSTPRDRRAIPVAVLLLLAVSVSVPIAASGAALLAVPGTALSVEAGVIAGIPTGVLVAWAVSKLQEPRLSIVVVQRATRGNRGAYWVHVQVVNSSPGLFGGGAATSVRAILEMESKPGTKFLLKWNSKPDPIELHLTSPATGTVLPNPHLYDVAATENVRGRPKNIGIIFKIPGDRDAYVHEPMTFESLDWRRADCRIPPGDHRISISLEYDQGDAGPFDFILQNQDSTAAGTLRLLPGGAALPALPS